MNNLNCLDKNQAHNKKPLGQGQELAYSTLAKQNNQPRSSKKIHILRALSMFFAGLVFAYCAAWAWAVHWIDARENKPDITFGSAAYERIQFSAANAIWKITPAIDRDMDARRLLKLSSLSFSDFSFSVITKDLSHEERFEKISTLLIKNYNSISSYYSKYRNVLSTNTKNSFTFRQLIYISRAVIYSKFTKPAKDILPDEVIKEKLDELISLIPLMSVKEQVVAYNELIWFNSDFVNAEEIAAKFIAIDDKLLYYAKQGDKEKYEVHPYIVISIFYETVLACMARDENATAKFSKFNNMIKKGGGHNAILINKIFLDVLSYVPISMAGEHCPAEVKVFMEQQIQSLDVINNESIYELEKQIDTKIGSNL